MIDWTQRFVQKNKETKVMNPLPRPKRYTIGKKPSSLPTGLINKMNRLDTPMLGHILYWGCMDRGIQANKGFSPRTVGRALTVQCPGPDSTILHHAIELASPGDILVIDRLGDDKYACLGDGVAKAASLSGIIGAIIDGPCTDSIELAEMGFPVWCRGTAPVTTRLLNLAGRIHVPVSCGGVPVLPGNAILADSEGVYSLSPDEADIVTEIALTRAAIVEKRRKTRPAGVKLGRLTGASELVESDLEQH